MQAVDRMLFIAASSFGPAADRRAFLDFACKDDKPLQTLIEDLFEIERDADEFFECRPDIEAVSERNPDADGLLDRLPAHETPVSLESANTLINVANWNLERGCWKAAANRFNSLAHVLTSVDMTDTDTNSCEWLPAAVAISEWGEEGEYDNFRNLAISRFAESSNATVAEHLIKATMLRPADSESLRALAPLVEVIESTLDGPDVEQDTHLVAWRQCALALLKLRQDDPEAACRWARLSLDTSGSHPRDALNRLILAMIDLRQARAGNAGSALQDVRQLVEQWEVEPFSVQGNLRISWSNWGAVRILLREAEAMLPPDLAAGS